MNMSYIKFVTTVTPLQGLFRPLSNDSRIWQWKNIDYNNLFTDTTVPTFRHDDDVLVHRSSRLQLPIITLILVVKVVLLFLCCYSRRRRKQVLQQRTSPAEESQSTVEPVPDASERHVPASQQQSVSLEVDAPPAYDDIVSAICPPPYANKPPPYAEVVGLCNVKQVPSFKGQNTIASSLIASREQTLLACLNQTEPNIIMTGRTPEAGSPINQQPSPFLESPTARAEHLEPVIRNEYGTALITSLNFIPLNDENLISTREAARSNQLRSSPERENALPLVHNLQKVAYSASLAEKNQTTTARDNLSSTDIPSSADYCFSQNLETIEEHCRPHQTVIVSLTVPDSHNSSSFSDVTSDDQTPLV